MTLDEISNQILVCKKCPLAKSTVSPCPGYGNENAEIFFIAGAPQDQTLSSETEKFLEELLNLAKINKNQVFITNIVKCRPPHQRDPLEDEIRTCTNSFLFSQIRAIKPKLIVTFGKQAMQIFFPQLKSVTDSQGKAYKKADQVYLILNQIEAVLRQDQAKEAFKESFLQIPELIKKI